MIDGSGDAISTKRAVSLTRQGWIACLLIYGSAPLMVLPPEFAVEYGIFLLALFALTLFAAWRSVRGWMWLRRCRGVLAHVIASTVLVIPPLFVLPWAIVHLLKGWQDL